MTHSSAKIVDLSRVREQGLRAPRYTSYPTALQLREGFDLLDYQAALRNSNDLLIPSPLAAYLHLPFCASACYYCGCHRVISRSGERHLEYVAALEREIRLRAVGFDRDRQLAQVHFGGGTPNLLRPRQLGRLLLALDGAFGIAPECEISLEVDPRQVRERDPLAWAVLGFNRISIGVQDIHPGVQRAVNRRQPAAQVARVVATARAAGIEQINFDLIYGLPGQNHRRFERTLDFVAEQRPPRVAVYHYAHLPAQFPAQRAIDAGALPALDERLRMQAEIAERLCAEGYLEIGLDHFALPGDPLAVALAQGTLRRNFQGYTTLPGRDLIGLGVSAISSVGDCMVQNHKHIGDWQAALASGRLPFARGLVRSAEDWLRGAVIEELMCQCRIDMSRIEREHGLDFRRHFAPELARLEALDPDRRLARLGETELRLTEEGRRCMRLVARCFDAYAADEQRLAKAL